MSDFDEALGYVHAVLSDLHSRGAQLVVPARVLQALASAGPVAKAAPVSAAHAPERPSLAAAVAPALDRPPLADRVAPVAKPPATAPRAFLPVLPTVPKFPSAETAAPAKSAPAAGSKTQRLAAFREKVLACTKCAHLVRSRTGVVFGVGNPEAELMFVGEAPGEDEDLQGEPFVGKAGQLLTKIIEAMGFRRDEIYIANVLKCRPDMPAGASGNRKPTPDEMKTCLEYLEEQIDIIQPRALVALGATAVQGLTGNLEPVGRLRGKWQEFRGIPLMVTYHPAYLLRNQSLTEKRKVWEDMLLVLEKLGRPLSEKQRNYFTKQ